MAPRKIIIDTDPGIDDILAMLLAFSALPEELEILLISVTYGNIDVQNALRNVVTMFYQIEKEISWRKSQPGRNIGFEALERSKPIVAVGPEHPLADQIMMADYFHGRDGLGGIHDSHPHLTPTQTWQQILAAAEASGDSAQASVVEEIKSANAMFTPSREPGAREILRLLRENEPDSVTIVAVGPLTNLALAAAEDPETFLRVKEVVVMGGNVDQPGNITPAAEFNTFADAVAAARLYALTSPTPRSTMPPTAPAAPGMVQGLHAPPPFLAPYPEKLPRQLNVMLFPLDITEHHSLSRGSFRTTLQPLLEQGSPLAEWMKAFMDATFVKMESLTTNMTGDAVTLSLHDPLCIWYCIGHPDTGAKWRMWEDEDLRVETSGQWTRGMCVVDQRPRKPLEDTEDDIVAGDHGNWLHPRHGNRLKRCIQSFHETTFGETMLKRIFAL